MTDGIARLKSSPVAPFQMIFFFLIQLANLGETELDVLGSDRTFLPERSKN